MIKAVVLDVDGTLTDGKININEKGELFKSFHVKDGFILAQLKKMNIIPIIITGRNSPIVEYRAKELQIQEIYQGISDKLSCCTMALDRLSIKWEQVLYIGDDLNDLICMKQCGICACPQDAVQEIKNICSYISPYKGGEGAVRDCIEAVLKITGQWDKIQFVYNRQ